MIVSGLCEVGPLREEASLDTSSAAKRGSLPEPSGPALLDALTLMYVLESKEQQLGLAKGRVDVEANGRARDEQRAARKEAAEQARKATEHASVFGALGSALAAVGQVAGVIASVAVAVVSMGAATPIAALAIAGAVASTAGFAQGQFGVLQKLGVDPKTAGWIGLGLSLGGAVMTGGATAAASASSCASEAASAATRTASGARSAVATVASAGTGAAGVSGLVASQYSALATNHAARGEQARAEVARLQRQLQALFAEMGADAEQSKRVSGSARSCVEAYNEGMLALARRV